MDIILYTKSSGVPDQNVAGSDLKGLIFDVMRFSLHDGPGIRTTVFFKGCPLECWWCHNPEGLSSEREVVYLEGRCVRCGDCVTACPHHAISWTDRPVRDDAVCQKCGTCAATCPSEATQIIGRWVTVDQLIEEISRDALFFDESGGGVTFSGGEPLAQARFLEALLDECRERRIHTAVETCGAVGQHALLRVSRKVDLFLYDLKLMHSGKHKQYTGAGNERILQNLVALANGHRKVIVRMPVIPGVNDDERNAEKMAEFLKSAGISQLDLLPYHDIGSDKYTRLHRAYRLEGLKPPSTEAMNALAERFRRDGLNVCVGG